MRHAKTIAFIVASAYLALVSYYVAMPTCPGGCGCGFGSFRRSFTIPGTAGKLRVVEVRSRSSYWHQVTELYIGGGRIDVPLSPSFGLVSFVIVAATLAGFAPQHLPILRLLGFTILALVFTHLAVQLAAGELTGFLSAPLYSNKYLVSGQQWGPPLLLSLTTTATIVSWLASFRLCKKFVHDELADSLVAGFSGNRHVPPFHGRKLSRLRCTPPARRAECLDLPAN